MKTALIAMFLGFAGITGANAETKFSCAQGSDRMRFAYETRASGLTVITDLDMDHSYYGFAHLVLDGIFAASPECESITRDSDVDSDTYSYGCRGELIVFNKYKGDVYTSHGAIDVIREILTKNLWTCAD